MNREPDPHPQSYAPRRVEAYLDAVLTSLPRRLSAFQISELRRELRTHLWERVAAYEELGQTEDEAVTEALQQFGGGKDFVTQWRRGWTKTPHRVTLREICEATRISFRPTLNGLAAAILPVVLVVGSYSALHGSPAGAFMFSIRAPIYWSVNVFAFVGMPVLIGIRQERRLPGRAVIGLTAMLSVLGLVASLLYQIGEGAVPGSPVVEVPLGYLLVLTAAWIPIAGGTAALTGWWARRTQARRVA